MVGWLLACLLGGGVGFLVSVTCNGQLYVSEGYLLLFGGYNWMFFMEGNSYYVFEGKAVEAFHLGYYS